MWPFVTVAVGNRLSIPSAALTLLSPNQQRSSVLTANLATPLIPSFPSLQLIGWPFSPLYLKNASQKDFLLSSLLSRFVMTAWRSRERIWTQGGACTTHYLGNLGEATSPPWVYLQNGYAPLYFAGCCKTWVCVKRRYSFGGCPISESLSPGQELIRCLDQGRGSQRSFSSSCCSPFSNVSVSLLELRAEIVPTWSSAAAAPHCLRMI